MFWQCLLKIFVSDTFPGAFKPLLQVPCRQAWVLCSTVYVWWKSRSFFHILSHEGKSCFLCPFLPSSSCPGAVAWGRVQCQEPSASQPPPASASQTPDEIWTLKLLTLYKEGRKARGKERRGRKKSGVMPQLQSAGRQQGRSFAAPAASSWLPFLPLD